VTSARSWGSGFSLTPFRERGQLVSNLPELGERRLRDEPAEELDGRPLRPDHLVADDARDHLVVAQPPVLCLLVELDQRLREAVEVLVLASLDVDVGDGEPGSTPRRMEGLPETWKNVAQRVPAGRVEPRAVAEHFANLLVLPRGHVLEHVQLPDHEANAERRALEKTKGALNVSLLDQSRCLGGIAAGELQPQLGGLVRDLEEKLVTVHPLLRPFL